MNTLERSLDILVIGAGQAGLAAGYYLKQTPYRFQLVESHPRVGESWRRRYDSLMLFTPRDYSALPGRALAGEREGYPTKDELADYLEDYARHFALPVVMNTSIERLEWLTRSASVSARSNTHPWRATLIQWRQRTRAEHALLGITLGHHQPR